MQRYREKQLEPPNEEDEEEEEEEEEEETQLIPDRNEDKGSTFYIYLKMLTFLLTLH